MYAENLVVFLQESFLPSHFRHLVFGIDNVFENSHEHQKVLTHLCVRVSFENIGSMILLTITLKSR